MRILQYFLQGSPLRWAAKADEIGMTSSVTSACSPLKDSECTMEQTPSHQQKQQRSCSANQLDAIGKLAMLFLKAVLNYFLILIFLYS